MVELLLVAAHEKNITERRKLKLVSANRGNVGISPKVLLV
jgi:hypothetical protein